MTYRTTLLVLALAAVTPAAAPAQWALKPDPPAETVDWPADLKPDLPGWQSGTSFAFAEHHGPFAALGGWREPWAVYDLRTSKIVGKVDAGVIVGKAVLSRDGTRMAGIESAGELGKDAAVLADTATGKEVRRVPVRSHPYYFQFAGRDRIAGLFVVTAAEDERGVRFVDFAAGAEGALLPGKVGHARAASPGGRYFAVATKEKLFVLATADESVAARLALPEDNEGRKKKSGDTTRRYEAHTLAFSPDGTKLGGVFHHIWGGNRVFWWDLATGVRGGGYKIDERVPDGNRFEWSADGAALLVNERVVLDAASGKVLWKLPQLSLGSSYQARRLLSADRALSVEPIKEYTPDYRLVVRTRP